MESDPAEKYPVVCHAVLGRRALPAAGGGPHYDRVPRTFTYKPPFGTDRADGLTVWTEQKSPVTERSRASVTRPCQNSYFSSHTWKI